MKKAEVCLDLGQWQRPPPKKDREDISYPVRSVDVDARPRPSLDGRRDISYPVPMCMPVHVFVPVGLDYGWFRNASLASAEPWPSSQPKK